MPDEHSVRHYTDRVAQRHAGAGWHSSGGSAFRLESREPVPCALRKPECADLGRGPGSARTPVGRCKNRAVPRARAALLIHGDEQLSADLLLAKHAGSIRCTNWPQLDGMDFTIALKKREVERAEALQAKLQLQDISLYKSEAAGRRPTGPGCRTSPA